jgi:hypothetical protein
VYSDKRKALLDAFNFVAYHSGMEMNVEKSKAVNISRQPTPVQSVIDQKQSKNVEYFKYLGSRITNDARCTRGTDSRIAMTKTAFNKKTALFTSKGNFNLQEKLLNLHFESSFLWC